MMAVEDMGPEGEKGMDEGSKLKLIDKVLFEQV